MKGLREKGRGFKGRVEMDVRKFGGGLMLFSRGKMKQYINQLLDQLHTLWLIV